MKHSNRDFRPAWLLAVVVAVTGVLLCGHAATAWGLDTSGLSLVLRLPEEQRDLHYLLGAAEQPVTVIMTLCNETGKAIATERSFANAQLQYALIVIDPNKTRHYLRPESEVHRMPQPYFLNNRPWALARLVPADLPSGGKYCFSTTIDDLRERVGVMKTTPGTYRIFAQMPFVRFAATGQDAALGLIGLLENDQNWSGVVNSAESIEIFIDPPAGARFRVQLFDAATEPAGTPFQVPVKVFKTAAIKDYPSLQETWTKAVPVIEKTTDVNGQAILTFGAGCLSQDDYTIIANYAEEFKASSVSASETGWTPESCSGEIAREIAFTGSQQPEPLPGDLDHDGDVDMDDLNLILAARNTPASGPDDPRDLDDDGMITGLDARKLVLLCTRPRCATK